MGARPDSDLAIPNDPFPNPPLASKVLNEVLNKRAYKKRIGNGHKSLKIRNLWGQERNDIQYLLFMPKNGQINNDDCVAFKNKLAPEVAIFQVTGFVSVLHSKVAEGALEIKDLTAYETWMFMKYGGVLWARYTNYLYVQVRSKNLNALAQGQQPVYKVTKEQKIEVS